MCKKTRFIIRSQLELTSDCGRVRRHHVFQIRCARRTAYNGSAEETVCRSGELLADIVAQQLEITHLSRDTVTVAPCCAGRIRFNDQRSCAWIGEKGRDWAGSISGYTERWIDSDSLDEDERLNWQRR